jgi:hypothetical protein
MFKIFEDNSIEMIRGDSAEFDIEVVLVVDEDTDEEEPYPLGDNDVLVFTVKKYPNDGTALIQKTGSQIVINPNDTKQLPFGVYRYDVQLTLEDGHVDTIIPPTVFRLLKEVTW